MAARTVKAINVAVIGAGPAGSWAAYRLAQGGASVRLYDPSHPREKPCGGGVTGRALHLVAGAVSLDTMPGVRIRAARFVDTVTGASATVPLGGLPNDGALVVASRRVFDGQLLAAARRAGAQLVPARVAGVEAGPDRCLVRLADGRCEQADVVIGADGATSVVRRQLAGRFGREQLTLATGFFVHGASTDEIVVELRGEPPGYFWVFPRPGHLAAGVCADLGSGATPVALRSDVARWIRTAGWGSAARLEPYAWPIPSLSAADLQAAPLAGPRWFLTGDAAGLVDPITREGIYFALRSADAVADALLSDAANPYRQYEARVRQDVVVELTRAARFKARFFRPRFLTMLARALADSAPIRGVMKDLVVGAQGYRGLKWRLVRSGDVRLAWRWLSSLT